MTDFRAFLSKKAGHINKARLDHLDSLGLPLRGKRVLEPGAGIGLLTGFFEDLDCTAYSTDGRQENVKENLRLHPGRRGRVGVVDLMMPKSHDHLGIWDVVFCYGTLYHVPDPALVLKDLAHVCEELFLLETIVHPHDDGRAHQRQERKGINQGLHKTGCHPARDWLMNELGSHFKYVYHTRTQPDHLSFPLEWPPTLKRGAPRSVFVASRKPLVLLSLSGRLLNQQERYARLPD